MSGSNFDAIVVGVGGMGSAALFELARRGRRVLGLEQFAPGHDRGSSHGQTRIIRQAYYEHPAYVPLLRRAYERWYDLEQRQGLHLFTTCPCLSIGPPTGELVAGVLRSADEHSLPVEQLSPEAMRRRFPMFRFGDEYSAVVEPTAGFLYVEDCVRAHAREAERLGATLRTNEPVVSWRSSVLTVMRQVVLWFGPRDDRLFRRDIFPVFIAETPEAHFYGLPMIDANGVKVARHYAAPELTDVSQIDANVVDTDEVPLRGFLSRHLPDADGPRRRGSVCRYTLTSDRHFVIDVHPDQPNVVLAAGFSGHGFKFASVVGEILADLAEHGRTPLPIELFRLKRFDATNAP
jgi:sarcosine oxidase